MDITSILALVLQGINVAEQLIAIGKDAAPAFKVLSDLVTGAQTGQVTDQQLIDTEKALDDLIADFNTPLEPPASVQTASVDPIPAGATES